MIEITKNILFHFILCVYPDVGIYNFLHAKATYVLDATFYNIIIIIIFRTNLQEKEI